MWVAIWWQWVCGCFDSLSQIGRKFWFSFEFLLWVSVHLPCLWLSLSGRCCVGLLERRREKGGEKRKIGKKREEMNFFILFVIIIYIILMSCM